MYARRTLILAALLAGGVPAAARAQRDRDRDRDDYRSRIDTTVPFNRQGTIDLSLISGDIRVSAWDRAEVHVRATTERGTLRLDAGASRLSLETRNDRGEMGDTHYELSVPTGAHVVMHGTSADETLRGVKGEVEARSVSGDIDLSDLGRRVSFESVSGSVKVSRMIGDVHGNSVSGDLVLRDVTGEVEVETVSGEITLAAISSRTVRAETVSGEITFDGSIASAGRYEFRTHSGDLRLSLPRGLGASFRVETFSGGIDSCFPITLQKGEQGGRPMRYEFKIGDGSARVAAETFSGDIDLSCSDRRTNPED